MNTHIDFLGIGAQKSATSWLFKCLQEHPELCLPEEKEVNFFNNEINYSKGISWYESRFSKCELNKKRGEISTLYLSNKEVPKRIFSFSKEIKLIVILRDPVERSFSHIKHLQSRGSLQKNISFFDAVKKFPEIIENGLYGKYLSSYLNIFPRENILVLFYEDVEKTPLDVIKRTFSFLGVEDSFVPKAVSQRFNTSAFRLSLGHNFINKTYIILRGNLFGNIIIFILKKIGINSGILNHIFIKNKKSNYQKEDSIKLFFKKDIELLENILGLSLSHWK